MRDLINKSDENFKAIDLLIAGKLYSPVVHCAYYSALQMLIESFYFYCNITEEQVQLDIAKGGNSHNYYLGKIVEEFRKVNSYNASKFYYFFTNFKRKRVEADYLNIMMSEDDGNNAKENAKKIRTFLNTIRNEGRCENIHNI